MSGASDLARMEEILRSLGVEMKVGGCGCCGSPWIEFRFNGQEFKSEYEQLDTNRDKAG